VNTANKDGNAPLCIAGLNGHVEVVQELLNHGAIVNTANEGGDIPLYVAGQNRHIEVVRELFIGFQGNASHYGNFLKCIGSKL
jgi:ankyrin repeat protein